MVIRLAQLDLKGMIPGWIISMGKKRAATNHARLRSIAESDLSTIPLDSESDIDRPSLIVDDKRFFFFVFFCFFGLFIY